MTVSRASLALTALALAALTGCADVGSSTPSAEEFPVPKSTDQNVIVCESIKQRMKIDKKAADEARAAGNTAEVKAKEEAFQSGVVAVGTVPGCDASDLIGASASAVPSPS